MKKWLLLLIFFFLGGHASAEEILDERENNFPISTPYKMTSNVNPITGDLIEEEIDFVVAGAEPLSLRRFYNHSSTPDPRYGGWRYNPESYFVANFEWSEQQRFAAVGTFDGCIYCFRASPHHPSIFSFELPKDFVTFDSEGQRHPLNTQIKYWKTADQNNHTYFRWEGEITDGNGCKRIFSSPNHCWLNKVQSNDSPHRITPNIWTPYQITIQEERRPNGNIICYQEKRWKDEDHYPKPRLLEVITAYNSDKSKELGSIKFIYHQDKHGEVLGFTAIGSDNRNVRVVHQGRNPTILSSVYAPDRPAMTYGYQGQWINTVEKPEGRIVTTAYSDGKVSAQYAPVGRNGEMLPIGRYEYLEGATIVYDAEAQKTVYRYDENKKLTAIEYFQDERLYRSEQFTWDDATGHLLCKRIEGDGALQISEYQYDKNHNLICQKIGDGEEWRTVRYTYSDDGFNLKLTESDREGKRTCYAYIPGTNLLASELVYKGSAICKRTFYLYDDCAVCIKTIIDDGSTTDPDHLKGVTYRKITEITPKRELPCIGLPEVVEEKTVDASGRETLLSRVIYSYTLSGKVLKEEHYDADGIFCYSIENTYDDRERLTSTTDPLGHKTSWIYDLNHNPIAISGPRLDQHREITYDKADRPTSIADWQSDGSVLFTEKHYDKLGRLIREIDPCQHPTSYEYDALGRVISIIHPDGAVERREYDLFGNLTKEIDPEGYETRKTYNVFGQVLSVHYPDGSEEFFAYDSTGNIQAHLDRNGAKTVYTYDCFDHPIKTEVYSTSGKLLKRTTATWTPFCQLSETNDELIITYSYDFAGRKTGEQQGDRKIQYLFDSMGRVSGIQAGETLVTKEYDVCDRLIRSRTQKAETIQLQEEYLYDEAGNRTHVINSKGCTETLFNTDGRPLKVKDALGFTTTFTYSYQNHLTQTTLNPKKVQTLSMHDSRGREKICLKKNVNGEVIQHVENRYDKNGKRVAQIHTVYFGSFPIYPVTHRWEYGPMGRLEKFIEAEESLTQYLYDEKGRLKTIIKPDGTQLIREYDDLGRVVRFYALDFDYQYVYDSHDRVISAFDNITKKTTTRTYDALGSLTKETLANKLIFSNKYDARGRRTQLKLPYATTIDFEYDGIYLYKVSRGKFAHIYSHRNLEGEIIAANLPYGEIKIERDALGRYARLNAPYFSADYTFDPVGNLTQYRYQDQLGEVESHYAYDGLDQLTQEDDHRYCYDSLYNRLKKDERNEKVNSLCQITYDDESLYTYDLCGRLISDDTRTYTYDSLDRLTSIKEGDKRIEFCYDAFDRRLSKQVFHQNREVEALFYLWDDDHEIGACDKKGHILELRVLGESTGPEIESAVLYELKGKHYIPIHDHRGSVVTLIDLKKQTVESYRYNAFGEELTKNSFSPWRFSGKRVDVNLVYFGRRYYCPTIGRWITRDSENDGSNPYAYFCDAPIREIGYYSR